MKIVAQFDRTVRPREYESKHASVLIEHEITEGEDAEQETAKLFMLAQSQVLTQLGVEFDIAPDGTIVESEPPVTETQAVANVAQQMGGQVVQTIPNQPAAAMPPQAMAPAAPAPAPTAGSPGQCSKCGGTEWWDNRQDNQRRRANGNQLGPEWKCKNQQCKNPIWPSDYNQFKGMPKEPRG
jgi:hypothetical protein